MFEKPPEEKPPYSDPRSEKYAKPEIEQLSPLECEEKIAEYETLIADFEAEHDLEALHAIVELTPDDAPHNELREPARLGLFPIVKLMNFLESQSNVSRERFEELKQNYKKLSRAVGMINRGIVDHTR